MYYTAFYIHKNEAKKKKRHPIQLQLQGCVCICLKYKFKRRKKRIRRQRAWNANITNYDKHMLGICLGDGDSDSDKKIIISFEIITTEKGFHFEACFIEMKTPSFCSSKTTTHPARAECLCCFASARGVNKGFAWVRVSGWRGQVQINRGASKNDTLCAHIECLHDNKHLIRCV